MGILRIHNILHCSKNNNTINRICLQVEWLIEKLDIHLKCSDTWPKTHHQFEWLKIGMERGKCEDFILYNTYLWERVILGIEDCIFMNWEPYFCIRWIDMSVEGNIYRKSTVRQTTFKNAICRVRLSIRR